MGSPMGCGSSSSQENNAQTVAESLIYQNGQVPRLNETITTAYQRFDKEICSLEATCPGPRLATSEAWIEYLQQRFKSHLDERTEEEDAISFSEEFRSKTQQATDDEVKDIATLVSKLGVILDRERAAANEEFLANVSRKALHVSASQYYLDMIEGAKARANFLNQAYNKLRSLYIEQDGLIASINGGVYSDSIEEKLDAQLEIARGIRDKLGSMLEQWRTCGLLLKTAWKASCQARDLWDSGKMTTIEKDRLSLLLECRNAAQASMLAFECAEAALSQVDLKFVTKRQCLAVQHASVYMLTDIADEIRHSHTRRVFDAYQINLSKAVDWLFETFAKTLKKDFNDAEEAAQDLSKQLRNHRLEIFAKETGPKIYVPSVALDTG